MRFYYEYLSEIAGNPKYARFLLLQYLDEGEWDILAQENLVHLGRCRELLIAAGYTNAGLGLGTFNMVSRMNRGEDDFTVHAINGGKKCRYDGVAFIKWLVTETSPDREFLEGIDPLRNQVIEEIDTVTRLREAERGDSTMRIMSMERWYFSWSESCLYFWLNPIDPEANYGWYTGEELKGWLAGDPKSPVLKKNQPEKGEWVKAQPYVDIFQQDLEVLKKEIEGGDQEAKRLLAIALLNCPTVELHELYFPLICEDICGDGEEKRG